MSLWLFLTVVYPTFLIEQSYSEVDLLRERQASKMAVLVRKIHAESNFER